jgi:serine/threonine protein kinase
MVLAIGHLHHKGVVYRDIKPENILLEEDGYLVLTDFGLAQLLDFGESTDTYCGTPDYMAPEIIKHTNAGHGFPVDWWTIGILTYEMIVGRAPFKANNRH